MGSQEVDEPFDEPESFDEFDITFDERLRAEFAQVFPAGNEARETFGQLSQRFTRARRVQQAKQALVGVAASVALIAGVGFGAGLLAERADNGTTMAGEPEIGDSDGLEDGPELDESTETLVVTGTTVVGAVAGAVDEESEESAGASGTSSTDSTDAESPTSIEQAPTVTTAQETTSPTTPVATESTPPSTSQQPSTTRLTPTTSGPTAPGTTEVTSSCGSIVVSVSGSNVSLVETLPNSGYSVDVKSTGPDSIEVSFEGPRGHCEIEAEMRDGELHIDEDD